MTGKGIIVVVNKWDAIEKNDKTIYEYTNKIKTILSFIPYAEYVFVSAQTGQRLNKLYDPDRYGKERTRPCGFRQAF